MFLTGASTAGGAQTDPNAALGNHRSSTEAVSMGISVSSPIANITVDFASGGNALGAGSLECTGVSTLKWKDLGGTFGAVVTILNGETRVLEADSDPGAYIRITRTSATDLVPGTATVTLSELVNNLYGLDNVSSAEASAGDNEYRAFMVQNVSVNTVSALKIWVAQLGTQQVSDGGQLGASGAGSITTTGSFDTWPASGWCRIQQSGGSLREIVYYSSRTSTVLTVPSGGRARLGTSAAAGAATDDVFAVPGIRIAKDTEGVVAATEAIQTIANENTAPSTVTWDTDITSATGLDVGTMTTTQQIGIWIHREIPAGAVSLAIDSHRLSMSFDAI
jgi:hypothetical protein